MANVLSFVGEIMEIFPVQLIENKEKTKSWMKQEVVLQEQEGQYPQALVVESFGQEKIDKNITPYSVGDVVEVWFNAKARAYDKKDGSRGVSGSNDIWKVVSQSANQSSKTGNNSYVPPVTDSQPASTSASDDLPF